MCFDDLLLMDHEICTRPCNVIKAAWTGQHQFNSCCRYPSWRQSCQLTCFHNKKTLACNRHSLFKEQSKRSCGFPIRSGPLAINEGRLARKFKQWWLCVPRKDLQCSTEYFEEIKAVAQWSQELSRFVWVPTQDRNWLLHSAWTCTTAVARWLIITVEQQVRKLSMYSFEAVQGTAHSSYQ